MGQRAADVARADQADFCARHDEVSPFLFSAERWAWW
jgi:hypothetical protein